MPTVVCMSCNRKFDTFDTEENMEYWVCPDCIEHQLNNDNELYLDDIDIDESWIMKGLR